MNAHQRRKAVRRLRPFLGRLVYSRYRGEVGKVVNTDDRARWQSVGGGARGYVLVRFVDGEGAYHLWISAARLGLGVREARPPVVLVDLTANGGDFVRLAARDVADAWVIAAQAASENPRAFVWVGETLALMICRSEGAA